MTLPKNLLDCSELQIARDIPTELSFYKHQCIQLTNQNQLFKNALMVTGSGICLYIVYHMIKNYGKKKNQKKNLQ